MPQKKKKISVKKLTDSVKQCKLNEFVVSSSPSVILSEICNNELSAKFSKPKTKVPAIFLHQPTNFSSHARKILALGINFYPIRLGTLYTRICCQTFNDHKAMIQYFEKNQFPYHTFGHPSKRKMKVVIRGCPKDIDLNKLREELKSAGIPVVRLHIMRSKDGLKDRPCLILAVVPNNEEGRKILQVNKILDNNITIEPPFAKLKQCHRCQKWGHSQRYCHGEVKCLKCAGNHFSKKCTRDAAKEPPKCANCGGDHTANYKQCRFCPESAVFQQKVNPAVKCIPANASSQKKKVVTLKDCPKA